MACVLDIAPAVSRGSVLSETHWGETRLAGGIAHENTPVEALSLEHPESSFVALRSSSRSSCMAVDAVFSAVDAVFSVSGNASEIWCGSVSSFSELKWTPLAGGTADDVTPVEAA